MVNRRLALLATCTAGCAADPAAPPAGPAPLLTPWRTVTGGFIGPPSTAVPARPTGMYVKLLRPSAIAIRGMDLLVADVAAQRLWRADALAQTLVGIPAAPVGAQTALALGPDLSAWVLDPAAGQVLRFSREGRLVQTWRSGTAVPGPVGLALADGGATLLLADGLGAQWSEQRGPGGVVQTFRPEGAASVQAIALAGDHVLVLDRLAGVVHRAQRDGRIVQTLGKGDLLQPQALAVDRHGRVFVLDGGALKLLQPGQPARVIAPRELGVQQVGAIACDGDTLAVADPLLGQVALLRLGAP